MKTIVITGSTKGIGFGLAHEFLKKGHQVVINGRTEKSIKTTSDQLSEFQEQIFAVHGDISSHDFLAELYNKTINHFGKVDIWINNAGLTNQYKQAWEIDFKNLKNVLDVNIYGTITGTIVAYNHMKNQGFGKIFNLEGLGSDGRMINKLSIYGTSKRAVNYFTKAFSKEIKDSNVQIGVIQPGMVVTDLLLETIKDGSEKEVAQFKKVVNILGDRVEVVTPWISNKILESRKNYDKIKYSSIWKIIKNLITKRKII